MCYVQRDKLTSKATSLMKDFKTMEEVHNEYVQAVVVANTLAQQNQAVWPRWLP